MRRHKIQKIWGKNGDWKQSEEVTSSILLNEGFQNSKRLNYLQFGPFDVVAEKNGQACVFQVTTRIHTEKKRQAMLARDLKLPFYILFISLKRRKYILKLLKGGSTELSLKEVCNARKF